MRSLRLPSPQTILILIASLVALLTWLVPAGQYDTLSFDPSAEQFVLNQPGGTRLLPPGQHILDSLGVQIPLEKFTSGSIYKPVGIPGTYQELQGRPQGLGALVLSPVRGIVDAADIIFLVLIIGGLTGVMNQSGAFAAGLAWITRQLRGREYLLIVLVTGLVGAGGTTFGFAEETMAFYPILIPVFLAARYDSMVAAACIFLGSSIGSMCSTTNPFATIIASDSAGINWIGGLGFRLTMLLVCLSITIAYILRYASRVKADPSASLTWGLPAVAGPAPADYKDIAFTGRRRIMVALFSLSFAVMVVGVSALGWWFSEMSANFLVAAVLIAWVARMGERVFIREFVRGAGELLGVAFIIGLARGITLLMQDGLISDTVLFHASSITDGMNPGLFANVAFLFFGGLSFFMPSSSGMAVLTMPIMSPLADGAGVGRELVVNAYQLGLGLFYLINPTGLILAVLALTGIPFDRWLRFVLPLFAVLLVVSMAALTWGAYFGQL